MKRFSRKLLLELASIAFACLVLALGFVWWRLVHGPADVGFARPFVEAEFLQETGMHLSLDALSVGAHGWQSPLEVRIDGATIGDDAGVTIATIAHAEGTFSLRALVQGRFEPISVTVTDPVVTVTRAADGSLHPHFKHEDLFKTSATGDGEAAAEPPADGDLSAWENLSLQGGALVVKDSAGKELARADNLDATLERTPLGVGGSLHGTTKAGPQTGELSGAVDCDAAGKGVIVLQSPALRPDAFAFADPMLAGFQVPTSVGVRAQLNGMKLDHADIDVAFTAGQIVDPQHFKQPVPISGGALQATYQTGPERLTLRKFELGLGGPTMTATGEAHTAGGIVTLTADVTVADMPLDSFDKYWPLGVSEGGRAWVTSSLSKGMVSRTTAHLTGTAPRAALSQFEVTGMDGTIAVTGGVIHYFGELPPVTDASASITYNMDSMTITMLGGHAEDVSLTGGTIVLDGFATKDQGITIDLTLTGPVASALDIVAHKPLDYARKLQIDPAAITGTADTALHMAFPLISALKLDQIDLGVKSVLHDLRMPNAMGHLPANAVNGGLSVGVGGLEFTGTGLLGDIPLSLDYKQSFAAGSAVDLTFDGKIGDTQRGELGVDFPERLKGTVGVSGHYLSNGGTASADLDVDLAPATMAIDEIGYVKPPGQRGRARLTLQLAKGKLVAIDPLSLEAPSLAIAGSARLDPETGKIVSVTLDKFEMDKADMTVRVAPLPGGGSRIDVGGREFDARRFLHARRDKTQKSAPEANDATPLPLEIDVSLDRVRTGDTTSLTDVKGQLILLGRKWRRAEFAAGAAGSSLSLSYLPDSDAGEPSYTLHAGATDAGAALAAFALTSSVRGGTLTIDGKKPAPTADQPDPPLLGSLRMADFGVSNPPIFARLFNLLSLRGFEQSLDSSDIQFDSLEGRFGISGADLAISDGRLAGAAIGLTIAGSVDRDADTLDLHGTVVPAYGANRIIARIPVLGPLITGGDGEGFIAATYTITGPVETPDVALNPLSLFAPGVLRDLLFKPSDPDISAPDQAGK